jgi:uncharacterized protein (TIGR03437 family)
LYIVDTGNHRIRMVTSSGIISTVVGNGTPGLSGDDGPATMAQLSFYPSGIAFDDRGTLYIADSLNNRIRTVSTSGIISTIAGSGPPGAGAFAGDGGPATDALLWGPSHVAVSASGEVYLTDSGSGRIRELVPVQTGCLYSVQPSHMQIEANGGPGSISLTASRTDCSWSIARNPDWLVLTSAPSGAGNTTITFHVAANTSVARRSGNIEVAGQKTLISQPGNICAIKLKPESIQVPATGVSGSIVVSTTAEECWWHAKTDASWIFLRSPESGVGVGSLSYTVAHNDRAARAGTIQIGDRLVIVEQDGSIPLSSALYGVVNAASGMAGPVAPGEFVTLFGHGMGPIEPVALTSLSRNVQGVRVAVNGTECFLSYVSTRQINALLPYGISKDRLAVIEVRSGETVSNSKLLPVAKASMGVFTADGSGKGYAAAVNEDGTRNSSSNPARRGSILTIWSTGQGSTTPLISDGANPAPPRYPVPVLPVAVTLNGVNLSPSSVVFAGLVYPGVMQVNFRIPPDISSSSLVECSVSVDGASSQEGVFVAIE